MHKESELIFARWAVAGEPLERVGFMRDSNELPASLENLTIVLERGTEARAAELIALGAERVLLADAALQDSSAIERMAQQYGTARIGVWLPVKRRDVSWTLDCVSNEDFRCLTPSVGKAGWEVLMSDGTPTGTDAEWWVKEMLAQGASMALISVDIQDDDDLNICAGLVESHGDKLWFTPWQQPDADLEPWVRYGQVRQLVLPLSDSRDDAEMARIRSAALKDGESIEDAAVGKESEKTAI